MKAETLIQRHPPTPPNIGSDLQSGLHHIAQYNAERHYSFEDAHVHGLAYGSPGLMIHDVLPRHQSVQSFHSSHGDGQQDADFGLGIQYDGYRQGSAYYHDPQFSGLPNNQTMFPGSHPTPSSATELDEAARRTRSGRTIASSGSPQGVQKAKSKTTPKPKKTKTGQKEKPKTPVLTAPLSILTKDMTSVPVQNIEEWVNRSAEVRRKEVEKRNGYVTRPMNSFMLYRSAYAERTKQWCLQNNHQVVSSVSGESWPMEPPEVREMFNEYAKIERINHQNAHPTYKFSPSKAAAAPAKKRKGEYSDDELSDLDDAEWAPGHGRSRGKTSRRPERSLGYPANNINADFYDPSLGLHEEDLNRPSWDMRNDGRSMSMQMQGDPYGQYFQTGLHPSMSIGPGDMEDLGLRRVDTPGSSMQFSPGHSLLGLPGSTVADLMQQLQSATGTPLGHEGQVDPMLLAFDGSQQHGLDTMMVQHPEFRNGNMGILDKELDQDSVHSLLGAGPTHDDFHTDQWGQDSAMVPMEQGSEFEKWMDDHHGTPL